MLYLPAQIVGPLFQLVSVVAWTHFLAPDSLGVFALVNATQELAYIAALFWFTLYTMRYHDVTADADARRRFLDTEAAVMLGSVAISTVVVAGLVWIVEAHWSPSLVMAAITYLVTRAIATQLTDRARTEQDTLTYSVLQIVWPVAGLAFGIVLVKTVEPSAAMVLWGYALAQSLALMIAAKRLKIGWRPSAASRDIIRAALRYGVPLLAGGVFVWIAGNSLRFVIEAFEGAAAVGLVTVGWALGNRAANFAAMLVTAAAFPLAVKTSRERGMAAGQDQLVRNGVLLLMTVAPAVAGLWAIAPQFVHLVVAAPYHETTLAVLPLALTAGALRTLRVHFGEQVFLLRERPMVPLVNDIVDAALSVAGALAGLWIGGLTGSVAGAAAGSAIALVVTLASAWYWHRFTLPPIDVVKVALATLAMVVVVTHLPATEGAAALALSITAGMLIYAAVIAAFYPAAAGKLLMAMRRSLKPGVGVPS